MPTIKHSTIGWWCQRHSAHAWWSSHTFVFATIYGCICCHPYLYLLPFVFVFVIVTICKTFVFSSALICICHHLYLYLPPPVCAEKIQDISLSSTRHQGPNFSPAWEPEIHSGHKIASLHFFGSHRKLLRITNNGSSRREWFLFNWSSSCIYQPVVR